MPQSGIPRAESSKQGTRLQADVVMALSPDEKFMSMALRLAKKAEGMTSPNPLVGAVVVKDAEVIGRGYHRGAGLPHAEIEAFIDAAKRGRSVSGSTLYVTLEPCCHSGKRTPPCVDAIIEKAVARVVVGCLDLNPEVGGKGVEKLEQAGIRVTAGVIEERAREINEHFFKYITTSTPFVTLKLASTLDGKIATLTGDSKWIGSPEQRSRAHALRAASDAVAVGIGTVLRDNPRLNVRLPRSNAHQPRPVVLDSKLRIPLEAALLVIHDSPIIATTQGADRDKALRLEARGARVVVVEKDGEGRVDWGHLLAELGKMEVMSVLIEGGASVAASALAKGVVDKVAIFFSPRLVGGDGLSMIGPMGIREVKDSLGIYNVKVTAFGKEFVVEGYLSRGASG
ncbi:MAG: bifunctional diaminohydroxyphosphoribosylaminopyrimidine deaminase/5-amino-6-(5-phosphoribosylamino)uracil reductase RibD [Thermodesulfobacteriota bacterium]